MTPLDRRWKMLEVLLHRRRNTVNSLALEFDVSRFTVMRDIRALSCTFPIYTNHGGDGGVYIQDGYLLPACSGRLRGLQREDAANRQPLAKWRKPVGLHEQSLSRGGTSHRHGDDADRDGMPEPGDCSAGEYTSG